MAKLVSTTYGDALFELALEENKIDITTGAVIEKSSYQEPSWVKEVKGIDPLSMSPLEALNFLYELKGKIQKEEK